MSNITEIIDMLLVCRDTQLDSSMKRRIAARWGNPPKAIEILAVLDLCVHGSLASGFVISVLQTLYDDACKREGTTHDEVVKNAVWRQEVFK